MKSLTDYQAEVARFMAAGGQKVRTVPAAPTAEEQWLGQDMVQSEVHEMNRALKSLRYAEASGSRREIEDALVEYADALGDIVYVVFGRAAQAGIALAPVMDEISRSNNSKIDWSRREPWAVHPSGKIAKDHHFSEPDLRGVLFG